MGDTFYDVLGVSADASESEIRAAYRERVKETHPDVSDDPDADRRFKAVKRAKEVLTDPDERATYDRVGHDQYTGYVTMTVEEPGDDGFESAETTRTGTATTETAGGTETETNREASAGTAGASAASATASAATGSTTTDGGTATANASTDSFWDTSGRQGANWWADADATGPAWSTSGGSAYATDRRDGHRVVDKVRVPMSPRSLIQIGAMFVLYPVFLLATVMPTFPTVANMVVGVCTIFVVVYLLTLPEIGIAVFGAWSALAPVLLFAAPGVTLLSAVGFVAVMACWVPFALAILTRSARVR